MVLWNLLDGGPNHSGPLLGPFESMRGGTIGTNPHQQPPSPWQVNRCSVIWIFLVCDEFTKYSISGTKYSIMGRPPWGWHEDPYVRINGLHHQHIS
jgi:hypothetical protein